MIGPGKYDDACTVAQKMTKAEGTLLIVINGEFGSGFSAQTNIATLLRLPTLLREVATYIENDRR